MIYRESSKPEIPQLPPTTDKPYMVYLSYHVDAEDKGYYQNEMFMAQTKFEALEFGLADLNKKYKKSKSITVNEFDVIGLEDFGWFTKRNRWWVTRLIRLRSWTKAGIEAKCFPSSDRFEAAKGAIIERAVFITKDDLLEFAKESQQTDGT